jgi:hypothetical protein
MLNKEANNKENAKNINISIKESVKSTKVDAGLKFYG